MCRFIIHAQPRTGGTLLDETLNAHPQIHCAGEGGGPCEPYNQSVPWFFNYHKEDAVGFRLVDVNNADTKGCRDACCQEGNVRVILLERDDLLAQYVSFALMNQTGMMHRRSGLPERDDPGKIRVGEVRFRTFAEDAVNRVKAARLLWRGFDTTRVTYENLSGDFDKSIGSILRFLGVGYAPLVETMGKVETMPMSERVENYNDACRWAYEYRKSV